MHAAKARDTNFAATPRPTSLARHDAAETVTPARVTKSSKKHRWWRCLLQCFGCFSRRDDNTEGDAYTPHTPPPPSPTPPGPQPELPATEESSLLPSLPAPPLLAHKENFTLPPATPSPSSGTDEEPPLPAPSSLIYQVREEADAPTPATEGSGTVQPAEGKKNGRRRQRRRARKAGATTAPVNKPAPSHAATFVPAKASASTLSLTPIQVEDREALGDILDLVQLQRGQQLTYSRAVYVEGEDARDGDGWIARCDRKARERRPLQQEQPFTESTATASAEAAADGGGWTEGRSKRVRGRRPLQHKPLGRAPPAASSTATARQPGRRQQTARDSVWASWQEPQVECTLPVLPHVRRRIVGRGGAFLRDLRREFPTVRVRVPPPQDTRSRSVAVEGPRAQAQAVLARLRARLQEAAAPTSCVER